MSKTLREIKDSYGVRESWESGQVFQVVEDCDGDLWVGRKHSKEQLSLVGGRTHAGRPEEFIELLRDAGLLESESAAQSGSSGEEWDSAREWYEALCESANDTFHAGWWAFGVPDGSVGPDYDVALTVETSANVRSGPFFEEFGESIAYIQADLSDKDESEGIVDPDCEGMHDQLAILLDAPEGVDVSEIDTDPTPSPEDVAEWWYHGINGMGHGEIHAPIPETDIISTEDDHQQVFVQTNSDEATGRIISDNEYGEGLWVTELETVSADEVPTDE